MTLKDLKFSNLRVAIKLWLAVAVLVCTLLALIGFAATRSTRLQAEFDAGLLQSGAKLRAAARWSALTETNIARIQATVITNDSAVDVLFRNAIAATAAEIEQVRKGLEALPLGEAERALLDRISAQGRSMFASLAKLGKLKASGDNELARAEADAVFAPAAKAYLASLRELEPAQEALAAADREAVAQARRITLRVAQAVVALVVIGVILGTLVLVRSINVPLAQAMGVARRLAQGDLRSAAAGSRADEFGELMCELGLATARLTGMLQGVKATADAVATASREIAQGNTDLSTRTEQQASALEETSASMQQMSATVAQNAANARNASELAARASDIAARGGQAMGAVVGTMSGISESSRRIADIIGVIDGIAFQTNILALNAAVEAARAGEQGRGFAVVASEVRSLAQRSAAASKEIRNLIVDAVSRAESGSKQVDEAGTTIAEMIGSVKQVTSLIAEITAASQEQAQGIEQVSETMTQLEKVTQQNAAMVEEASAAAGSLEEQSRALAGAVGAFRLDEQAHSAAAPGIATPRTSVAPKQRLSIAL